MKKILVFSLLLIMAAGATMAEVTYSRELYEKAVMGDGESMYQLSLCYMNGLGVVADYDKSDYWLERAAREGQPNAVAAIRAMLGKTGLSDDKRRELAAEEKRELERLESNIKYDVYSDALLRKAQRGEAKAQCWLGQCYKYGFGVSIDYDKAVYWYRKAADQGVSWAQYHLGDCYYYGKGVTCDYGLAVYWFRKAAEQGETLAQDHLGDCYYYGNGVLKDYSQAVYWYRKAAEQGASWSQYSLGVCYENGKGVPKDINQAVEWYQTSARKGDKDAQKALTRLGYSW